MTLWNKISNLGVTEADDFRLARRIVLSNRFALLIICLTLLFIPAFLFRDNFPLLSFLGMLTVSGSVLFFNSAGLTQLSRFILSVIPAVGLFFLNISQKFGVIGSVDILNYATPRMIIIGSVILPFTMFIAKEKAFVWTSVAAILIIGFGYDVIHKAFGVDYKALGLENAHYGIIFEDTVVLAIIILASAGFMFNMNHRYDQHVKKLLDDALQQADHLKKNEGELKRIVQELEESRAKDEYRSWIAKGVAEMAGLLQTSENEENIYDRWLSAVIKYLKLNQGGLFISEEDINGKVLLKLVASYAYERKKYLQKTVIPGEGLLGQAYLEGQRIYLKKIPPQYVHITSGLGEAPPSVLVILPIKTDKTVTAVLEVAAFKELKEHELELLDTLGEGLAAFIMSHKSKERTERLLEQAQTMSEEMRASEEEMRQNLEELTATQEALARKEQEYQQRIADLESELASGKVKQVHA